MISMKTIKDGNGSPIIKKADLNYEEELVIQDMNTQAFNKNAKMIPNSQPVRFVLKGK